MGDRVTATERFWPKVEKIPFHECWEWTAARKQGSFEYGFFFDGQRQVLAHRFSWTLAHGPIADGLNVLHRCDNPSCVRSDHLFLGTTVDNVADKIAKGRQPRGARCANKNPRRGDQHHWSRGYPGGPRLPEQHWSERKPELIVKGSAHGQAKLDEARVVEIRRRVAAGASIRGTAREFDVSDRTIDFIVQRRTWRHV
jgi:hypothetical protein